MAIIRIGTYNVNNLFDRFDDPYLPSDDPWRKRFSAKPKKAKELYNLGRRIDVSNVQILALQEIESLGALREFIAGNVGSNVIGKCYPNAGVFSLESNDRRGIDLGVASAYPLGRIISHRFRKDGKELVFSRDCLQVEVLYPKTHNVMLTLYISHLKSKYSEHDVGTVAYELDQEESMVKRTLQVKHTIQIVQESQNIDKDNFVILGDMNDTPDSSALSELIRPGNPLNLVDALASIPQDDNTPNSVKKRPRDTHKWEKDIEKGHMETTYSQLDYIFLSKNLAQLFTGTAKVDKSGFTTGSDHFLYWAELNFDAL
jgi:endonuclease/exonuclease/phosphatase family metal-dependent hydrolase